MDAPLALIDAALRGMAAALLLLLAGRLLRERPRLPAAQAAVLLSLGLVVQIFSAAPAVEGGLSCALQSPLVGVAVANAVAFFLFVKALFDDAFRWRAWHALAWLFAFSVGLLNCALWSGATGAAHDLLRLLLRGVPLAASVAALHAALRHWQADLVEARRRLRGFVLATGVLYTLAQLGARVASPQGRLDGTTALLDIGALLFIAAGVAWQLLRLASTELFPDLQAPNAAPGVAATPAQAGADAAEPAATAALQPSPAAAIDADEQLAAALQAAMAEARAYREEGLTLAALAAKLAVPEYRLRRLINQRLGHRNFNAFVNGWRLAEARAALADPARRELPVLSIALEAGFGSIGPFNRAFKADTGLTPTEYRRDKLADS